jgi:hypothetical protein
VIKHLSAQGRPDSRGGLHYFWCPNKTGTLPLGASDTLTIVKKELEMKKLQPLKVQRVKKTQTIKHYKGWFQTPKTFLICCSVAIRVPT